MKPNSLFVFSPSVSERYPTPFIAVYAAAYFHTTAMASEKKDVTPINEEAAITSSGAPSFADNDATRVASRNVPLSTASSALARLTEFAGT